MIIGPTASGKSDLAVELALHFNGRARPAEILSADSVQIFRHLDIGSAKPTLDERRGVPHHLIDLAEPTERFTVADWLGACNRRIDECRARGVIPIVVGGTHLSIKALLDGLFEGPAGDPELRARLASLPPDELRARLEAADPDAAARLHPNDLRRTIRALEVHTLTGRPISRQQTQWDEWTPRETSSEADTTQTPGARRREAQLIILHWPTELLNRRINARVKVMMERGLLDEVRSLHERGLFGPQTCEALGYKQLLSHLRGECPLEDAVEKIKIETRRFAKNQRTWLRRLSAPTPGAPRPIVIDADTLPCDRWPELVLDSLSIRR